MNSCNFVGFITKKGVDLTFTSGTGKPKASFTLAVEKRFPKENDKFHFIPFVIWGKSGENLAKLQDKIQIISISDGEFSPRSYKAQDGTLRYVTEIVADKWKAEAWKDESAAPTLVESTPEEYEFVSEDDGDIPF